MRDLHAGRRPHRAPIGGLQPGTTLPLPDRRAERRRHDVRRRSGASGRAQARSRRPGRRSAVGSLRRHSPGPSTRSAVRPARGSSSGPRPRTARAPSSDRSARVAVRSPSPRRSRDSPPGTEYHVRLVAQSSAGTTCGADVVFRTAGLPTVGRASASAISLTRALIRADVSTGGLETQVWVEFGRGGSLTARTAAVRLPASASHDRHLVQAHRARARAALRLPRRRRQCRRHCDRVDRDVRHRVPAPGRARPGPPLHDRRNERPRPAHRNLAARRDLRPRRSRHARRPRPRRRARRAARAPTTSVPVRAVTGSSAGRATTSSQPATARRTLSCGGDGRDRGRLDRRRDDEPRR